MLSIEHELRLHFKLAEGQQIGDYFPVNKNSLSEKVTIKVKRAAHYLATGVRINEREVCSWVATHADASLSKLFKGRAIRHKVIRHIHGLVVPKRSLIDRCKEGVRFFTEFIRSPSTVGAILPSSKHLAKEIVKEIPKDRKAPERLILEVGPGSGIFTDKIISRMNPNDELHLVELDEAFCKVLTEKYRHIPNVKVFNKSILDHTDPSAREYDYVVSGLPLNAFEPKLVSDIFAKFTALTKKNGKISYFEYLGVPAIKMLFSEPEECEKLKKVLSIKKAYHEAHDKGVGKVFLNVPSARVLHHQINK